MNTSRARLALALCLFLLRAEPRAWAQESLLDKAGRQVSSFLEQMSDVKCTEQVTQEKLTKSGKTEYGESGTYDYLVLLSGADDELLLSESRIPSKLEQKPKNIPLLISNGFSTMFLIFHPYYRSSFRFEEGTEETIQGQRLVPVRFAHIAGTRTPAALAVRGREYPLDLEGTAWLEPGSGAIARIEATVGKDMSDVGLRSLVARVDYEPVRLPGWRQLYRFPVLATVEVETLRQHWRNLHRFSNYKRFMVDTEESVNTNSLGSK